MISKIALGVFVAVIIAMIAIASINCGGSAPPVADPQSPVLAPADTQAPVPVPKPTATVAPTATSAPSPTATPAPTSTPLLTPPPPPLSVVPPTEEFTKGTERVPEARDPRDPANIPDFYLERSRILAVRESGGQTLAVLASFDEFGEHFIAEFVTYPAAAFNDEIQSRIRELADDPSFALLNEAERSEKVSRWRPAARHISFLAWISFAEIEDGTVPIHIYARAEEGELVYAGTDTASVTSLSGGPVEIATFFFQMFNTYKEEP